MENLIDQFNDYNSSSVASLKGRVYRATATYPTLSVGTHYFLQLPESGKKLKTISFSGSVVGDVEISLMNGKLSDFTIGTTTETHNGYNLDATLESISNSPVLKVDSITGGSPINLGFAMTASSTGHQVSSSLNQSGLRSTYDNTHPVVFKVVVASTSRLNLVWIWEEV